MLIHQIQETEGIGNNAVKLLSANLTRISIPGPANSGIQLSNSGVLSYRQANGGLSQISGQWLIFGAAATFFIQRTILSGTLEADPGAGFLQLSTTRNYTNIKFSVGVKMAEVFFEISDDAGGTNILTTATMTFESEVTGTF